ncbi:hypothetical protein 1 [Spheniscid alphaherpesvirus 1]|uniref:Uncharacterized protein n=1 Tax=Spheniscid alphaherpesvirus 1 TaxID=2560777 RepID=A0A1R3T3Y8_9ALPH|nr:hypothetical protein 1 [Spheniscid alphaherpesvirus 1]SCO83476.1 hypothetical protein 1 [Spheniscid alphaherpesvirus 1]
MPHSCPVCEGLIEPTREIRLNVKTGCRKKTIVITPLFKVFTTKAVIPGRQTDPRIIEEEAEDFTKATADEELAVCEYKRSTTNTAEVIPLQVVTDLRSLGCPVERAIIMETERTRGIHMRTFCILLSLLFVLGTVMAIVLIIKRLEYRT